MQTAYVPGADYKEELGYSSGTAKYSIVQTRKLFCAWGGDNLWYCPGTEMNWILEMTNDEAQKHVFPANIFCSGFTKDSLLLLRKLIALSFKDSLTKEDHNKIESQIINKSNNYLTTFKNNHPVIYAFSPVLRDKNFFNKNTVADWPILKGSMFYYYKFIPLFLYYLTMILVLVASLWLLLNKSINLIVSVCLGHVFVLLFEFGYLIELIHYRYFASAYMACIFISCYFIGKITMNRLSTK